MKLFLGILVVVIFTVLGYVLGLKYSDRKKFYNDFLSFNKSFLDEISLNNTPIKEFLEENKNDTDFYDCLKNTILGKEFLFNKSYIKKDEKDFLKDYISSLGKSEIEEEKIKLKSYGEKISEKYNKCIEDDKKFRPLYIKLGFFIGLIVFIIIL